MKKNLKKNILITIAAFIISYIIAFIITNFEIFRIDNKGKINIPTNLISSSKLDKETIVEINIDKTYVDKLEFYYKSKQNFNFELIYDEENYYGDYQTKTILGTSSNKINLFSEKINNKISNLIIKIYDNDIETENFTINNQFNYFENKEIILLFLLFLIFIFIYYKDTLINKVEYIFLIISIACGIIYIFSFPVGTGISWDDQNHFKYSYETFIHQYNDASYSMLNAIENSGLLFNTKNEQIEFMKYLNEASSNKNSVFIERQFNYSKICYLPYSITFFIGDCFNIPFSYVYIIAKIIYVLIYSLVCYFAIKKAPYGKYLISTICLMPTAMFIASNFSYDAWVTSFLCLGISYYLYEYSSSSKNAFNIIISITSIVLGSLAKQVYIPILLIWLLLPKNYFIKKENHKKFNLIIICLCILVCATFVLPTISNPNLGDIRGGNTSVLEQLKLIIKQPLSFSKVFYDGAIKSFAKMTFGQGGMISLGYLGELKEYNFYITIIVLIMISVLLFENNKEIYLKKSHKIILLIVLFIIYCCIWGALYLNFTPVGSITMNGVQNRYFIPLFLPFFLVFKTNCINFSNEKKYFIFVIGYLYICIFSLLGILI